MTGMEEVESGTIVAPLAISNPDRKLLPGPKFLDNFLDFSRNGIAIDHIHSDHRSEKISYQELRGLVGVLSDDLKRRFDKDWKHNPIVPVIIPQQPALYVSYLAILSTGAAFCPISPDTPEERIRFIVKDVNARIILCPSNLAERIQKILPEIDCVTINLATLAEKIRGRVEKELIEHDLRTSRVATDVAYVMYTSGSTGKPKGVAISHRAITQSLLAHDEHIPEFKRFLQFAAPTFDVSIFEIFFTWLCGSTLVTCDRETMLADLPSIINNYDIDAVELTPTVTTTLLRTRSTTPKLKLLLTIGEMLTRHVVREYGASESLPGILCAMYGPTEASVHCTIFPEMKTSDETSNIGHPLSTVTAMILREDTSSDKIEILKANETGELAVAGQLADGYLNRPDQTSAAFLHTKEFGQIYRTGDRAFMTTEGNIHILGRISNGQVKIRGQRVELGEIEEAAYQVAGVRFVIAMVINQAIVLFCSAHVDVMMEIVEKRCRAWLPRHMRPSQIIVSEHDPPRLDSGKIDRKAIQTMFEDSPTPLNFYSSEVTATDTESALIKVFEAELITRLTTKTSLWSCGLDSLRAIRLASRLRPTFPAMSVSTILEVDNIAQLAHQIDAMNVTTSPHSSTETFEDSVSWQDVTRRVQYQESKPLNGLDIEELHPCTTIQIAMLSETLQDPHLNFNSISLEYDTTNKFERVIEAFENIAHKNPILRSGFISIDEAAMPFTQVTMKSLMWEGKVTLGEPFKISKGDREGLIKIDIHHALYDGWSWDLIVSDLNMTLMGQHIPDRPSYQDLRRSRDREAISYIDEDLSAWADYLHEMPEIQLPILLSNMPDKRERLQAFATLSTSVEDCEHAAKSLHVSTSTIVHSAILLLLSCYLDSEDLVTGLVTAGRDAMQSVEEVIGPCLLTFPIVSRLANLAKVPNLLFHVYSQHLHCLRHSNVSLAQIQSNTSYHGETGLFDIIFVWQESLFSSLTDSGPIRTTGTFDNLRYPLVFEVEPMNGVLNLRTTFDSSRWSLQQVELFHNQIDICTNSIVNNLNSDLEVVWTTLLESVLSISNPEYEKFEVDDLSSIITRQSIKCPDNVAIDFVEVFDPGTLTTTRTTLTYAELNERSHVLALHLQYEYGISRDQVIAVSIHKSVNAYVLICAIAISGCAYLCIEPSTPKARIETILKQAECVLHISDTFHQKDFPDTPLRSFEGFLGNLERVSPDNTLRSNAKPSDLAYVVFTSGSTGVPKGVLITRENLMSNLQHLTQVYPHERCSRLLQSCSLSFDVSVFEIFWTWNCGMTLCSATNEVLFRNIETFINAQEITHLSMTPSVAALVNPHNVPKVGFLVCAGEPMSAKVFEVWSDHGLHQGYGPSETTNICNLRNYADYKAPINLVGPSFPNTSIFVCRRLSKKSIGYKIALSDFQLLPHGAVGEIWIGGAQVGRGYTDASLTARSWFNHPQYGMLYRSGDIGRLLADGSLMILGRDDDQTKIRGQRIDLVEINLNIIQSEIVSDAVALIVKDTAESDRLIAFCVLEGRTLQLTSDTLPKLFNDLQERLPSYMVPELLIPTDSIPLTKQGKVDKRELTQRYSIIPPSDRFKYAAVTTNDKDTDSMSSDERLIAEVISAFTNVPITSINLHASFLAYGIDSISAITLAGRLRKEGFSTVDVSTIMRYPSVRRLSSKLGRCDNLRNQELPLQSIHGVIPSRIQRSVREQLEKCGKEIRCILPCTPVQEAILASSQELDSGSYVNHITYKLAIDTSKMKRAWTILVERHQVFRTTFVPTEDSEYPHVQTVYSTVDLPWLITRRANLELFSPVAGDLFYQIQTTSVSSGHCEMHLFMHHALYDAEALGQIHHEIELLCNGLSLPPVVPFSRYLQFRAGVDCSTSDRYWDEVLSTVTPCRIADLFRYTSRRSACSSTISENLTTPLHQMLEVARQNSSTPLSILQTALARFISSYLSTSDACFGTIFSGRNISIPGIAEIIGPCFNTIPSRVRIHTNSTNKSIMNSFQKLNASSLMHQTTSLRILQKKHSPDGRPLFDVLLVLQSHSNNLDPGIWQLTHEHGQMDFPFIIEIVPNSDNDQVRLYLHSTVLQKAELQNLLQGLVDVMDHTINNPGSRAQTLDVTFKMTNSQSVKRDETESVEHSQSHTQRSQKRDINNSTLQILINNISLFTEPKTRDWDMNTTIFRLGFDSISVIQLASKLRSQGMNVSAADILENPHLGDIAQLCTENSTNGLFEPRDEFNLEEFDLQHRPSTLDQLRCAASNVEAVWPCTSIQIGIISEYLQSGGQLYYNEHKLRLHKSIDLPQLRSAIEMAIERHVMLRTGFVEIQESDRPYAMVIYAAKNMKMPTKPASVDAVDMSNLARPPWYIDISERNDETFVSFHLLHSLYDARSLDIILTDVSTAYKNRTIASTPSVAKALSMIISQSQDSTHLEEVIEILRPNMVPTLFPDLNVTRGVPCKLLVSSIEISSTLSDLQASCKSLDATLWTICQVAWARLLGAYCDQSCVTFGAVLAGRNFEDSELNEVAFPCMNTVPVAYNVALPDEELIRATKHCDRILIKNQHISLAQIKSIVGLDGKLFDSLLVLQDTRQQTEGYALWTIESDTASAEYILSMEIIPINDTISLQITFDQTRIPDTHATILLRQFENLIYQVLRTTGCQSVRTEALLAVLPPKQPHIPSESQTLHGLVLSSAATRPHAIALEFVTDVENIIGNRQSWTYTDLVAKSSSVANALLSNGAVSGELVAICFDKCPEASFALLGVLMAGCSYVAIDPTAPTSRRNFIIRDARCKVVLTAGATGDLFEETNALRVLKLKDGELDGDCDTKYATQLLANPNDVCYCLYTSGTTGEPKGCLISHNSAVQAMLSFSRIFEKRWTNTSKWLQFASYHFDVSILEHFWSWSEGLCVTVVPRDTLFEDMPKAMTNLKITHLDLTPSLARLLTPQNASTLGDGVFIVGGEEVGQDIIEVWGEAGCLYNFYGPSEVTIGCTVHPRVRKDVKPTNIGRQWDNVGSFVLEPSSEQPVMIGAVGELCLSGPLVGQGYLNRPELTAKKFVTLLDGSERVYRTGDLVRMLNDHSFEFLGRIDDQIKLRGQRLEISEINHVLRKANKDPNIATLVLKHPEQNKEHLVSFLARTTKLPAEASDLQVLSSEVHLEAHSRLRKHATMYLPAYMVPTYFISIDFIPLTVNNKADTRTLRNTYHSTSLKAIRAQQSMPGSASNISTQDIKRLIEVTAKFLRIDEDLVSEESSLFQLSMDSIKAIGLSRALKIAGYEKASVATIMKHSLIADLADVLQGSANVSFEGISSGIARSKSKIDRFTQKYLSGFKNLWQIHGQTVSHVYPCTPLQEGMILTLLRSTDRKPPYLTKFVYRLEDNIAIHRLSSAWRSVGPSLDILRTHFMATPDGYAQVITAASNNFNFLESYSAPYELENFAEIDNIYELWVDQIRHLEKSLPWAIHFFEDKNDQRVLMALFVFHGLYDGNSLQLLLDAVYREYSSPNSGKHSVKQFHEVLPYGPLLNRDDAPKFWQSNLPKPKLLNLRCTHDNRNRLTPSSAYHCTNTAKITQFASHLGVTISAVLHASWLYTLANHYGVNPTIGMVLSGRSIDVEDADRVIGPMFNTLPVSVNNLLGNSTISQLVRKCHDKAIELVPFQHSSLRDIRRWIDAPSNSELCDSLFVYQDFSHRIDQKYIWPWAEEKSDSVIDFPLNIEIERRTEDELQICIVSFYQVTEGQTPNRLMEILVRTLEQISNSDNILLPNCFSNDETAYSNKQNVDFPDASAKGADTDHEWSKEALILRTEIAVLAGVEECNILSDTPTIFELGLDSIDALKLVARLNSRGIRIRVSKMLQFPTIRGMLEQYGEDQQRKAKQMSEEVEDEASLDSRLIETIGRSKDDIEAIIPTTPLQGGMLLQFEQYFHTFAYRLKPDTDVARLAVALNETIYDLPILRTYFTTSPAEYDNVRYLQVTLHGSKCSDRTIETVGMTSLEPLEDYLKKRRENATSESSLPHMAIVTSKQNSSYLVFSLSHASYDAWSFSLLHNYIHQRYLGLSRAKQETGQIRKYVNEVQRAGTRQTSVEFWSSQVKSIQATIVRRPNQANPDPIIVTHTSTVSANDAHLLCRRFGLTMQSLGLTVWTLSLIILTGRLDVAFGVVMSGRTSEEIYHLIFPTFNTLIFRPKLDINMDKPGILRHIHNLSSQIFEHQNFPLSKVIRLAGNANLEPFNTLFTFQKGPVQKSQSEQLYDPIETGTIPQSPPYAVNVELEENNEQLTWTIAVKDGVMKMEELQNNLKQLNEILEYLVDTCTTNVFGTAEDQISVCDLKLNRQPALIESLDDGTKSKPPVASTTCSDLELQVMEVFSEVSSIDIKDIDHNTSLFSVGLDSISAIKVVNMLGKAGIKIAVSQILKAQKIHNIANFAARVTDNSTSSIPSRPTTRRSKKDWISTLDTARIKHNKVETVVPATGGQIYALDNWYTSGKRFFYPQFWLRIPNCKEERFRSAWSILVQRIPILRTKFCYVNSTYLQITYSPDSDHDETFPWRLEIVQYQSDLLVSLQIHHALYDAVSLGDMLLRLEYQIQRNISYDEEELYLSPLVEEMQADRLVAEAFWTQYLSKYNHRKFRQYGSFEADRSTAFHERLIHTESLNKVARREGITLQALTFAIVGHIIVDLKMIEDGLTEIRDVDIGIWLANRSFDANEMSVAIRPTFNVVPLRIHLGQDMIQAAKKVQTDLQSISQAENCGVSLRDIYRWTGCRLNCFVNFLRLPDTTDTNVISSKNFEKTVTIEHAQGKYKGMAETLLTKDKSEAPSPVVGNFTPEEDMAWCLPALDIEMKIDDRGYLAVGLFAPKDWMDETELWRLMDDIRRAFSDIKSV